MASYDRVPVSLTRRQWGVIQEALDECFYVVEHAQPGGLRRATRECNNTRRDELLETLCRLDELLRAFDGDLSCEAEVGVGLPTEFTARAGASVSSGRVRSALGEMGFSVPVALTSARWSSTRGSSAALDLFLQTGPEFTSTQITEFMSRVGVG